VTRSRSMVREKRVSVFTLLSLFLSLIIIFGKNEPFYRTFLFSQTCCSSSSSCSHRASIEPALKAKFTSFRFCDEENDDDDLAAVRANKASCSSSRANDDIHWCLSMCFFMRCD